MIAEALEQETEFGIVWSDDDGLRDVGCAVEVTRVLERLDDGRINIVTRGTRPFRIIETVEHLPYPAATMAWEDDGDEEADEDAVEAAHAAYAELVEQATDKEPDPDELAEMTAYAMAATVDFGLEAKQNLLELRSENARLRLITRLFRAATKRLDFIERAQVRASSNGKVRFG
jgi:Lon protease-like protein